MNYVMHCASIETAAKACAELVRQGIIFECVESRGEFLIIMTGGF